MKLHKYTRLYYILLTLCKDKNPDDEAAAERFKDIGEA